jgi:hypothetical protein
MQRGLTLLAVALGVAAGLSACGGGGSGTATGASGASGTPVQAAAAGTTSTGVITAFGSVFVGGHEFDTRNTRFIDDDSGAASSSASGLEVGMVVDVKPTSDSSSSAPKASELHIHPLARGYVDGADTTLGTLLVMGQTVQLTSSTNFSDHRACLSTTPATCTAITAPAGLSATSTASTPATPGSYVAVHGYLYGSAGTAHIVATLVSVADAPTATTGVNFKAEGLATVASGTVSIGGLTLDLSAATCRVAGATTPCATAFATGQVVAAGSALAPTLPATSLAASYARLASKTAVDTAGASVEMEGMVSSAGASSFVLRGVTVDTSALATGSTLPAVGDVVRVLGTVGANGQSVAASSVLILHAAASVKLGLEGNASAIAAGTAAHTYTLSVLGQTVTVNDKTRLTDMSVRGWDHRDPAANPFNISTFATYMAGSTSKHVIAKTETDANGNLVANSLAIVPASAASGVAGLVDASPAVFNSGVTGTPSTLSVHGIAIQVDPARVLVHGRSTGLNPVAAGEQVVALGTWNGTALVISATVSPANQLFDAGVPRRGEQDRGEF